MKTDREAVRQTWAPRAVSRGPFIPSLRSLPAAWLWLALAWCTPVPAHAQTQAGVVPPGVPATAGRMPEDPQTRWESQSVRELMQQDLRDALHPPVGGGQGGRPVPEQAVRPVLEPRLVALYGVGRALMAEVQVGRRAYLYVRGQAWPAGHAGDPGVYQLRGMNGACVQLERGQDRHSLCLRMLLGEARP
ncbi:hypothetical protein GCM10009125_06400 [Castellaniella daejeonensis]|jgi:hypothetical protein|uniref:Pilus assembly protein PilP n=1 Tax=Castellaniella daejeonensis TaxID=659013 RepID=A0ABN0TF87_9BURK|nr:hypothetical protein [Castellaniella sp.]HET8704030.1 hypothetical protein [Castellaniella sp.]